MEHATNIVLTASIVKESNNKMSTPTEMHIDALMNKIDKLETENARYREALEFYANKKYYYHGYDPIIVSDSGEYAREALKVE